MRRLVSKAARSRAMLLVLMVRERASTCSGVAGLAAESCFSTLLLADSALVVLTTLLTQALLYLVSALPRRDRLPLSP